MIRRVNGGEVVFYQNPRLDPKDGLAPASNLLKAGSSRIRGFGHTARQAEGQGAWFRNIELMPLEKP